MKGKLITFSSKEKKMWSRNLDERDMEILQDVLEAHLERLEDMVNDGEDDEDIPDEIHRVQKMLDLIYMEIGG